MWVCFILLLFVALDLSALVRYVTRFTEESFSVLISLIFIYEAFSQLVHILDYYPILLHQDQFMNTSDTCHCVPMECTGDNVTDCFGTGLHNSSSGWLSIVTRDCINLDKHVRVGHYCVSEKDCIKHGGNVTGPACYDETITGTVPDVFFFSFLLFLSTFGVAIVLNLWFRNSRFFPAIVRKFPGSTQLTKIVSLSMLVNVFWKQHESNRSVIRKIFNAVIIAFML